VSIIPLIVLAYLFVQYIFPMLGLREYGTLVTSIYITLALTILLSVLGYIMTRRITLATIGTIQQSNSRLAEMLEMANKLNRIVMVDEALAEATQSAVDILGADSGLLYLVEGEQLTCKYTIGINRKNMEELSCGFGETAVGKAAASRKTIRVADTSYDRRVAAGPGFLAEGESRSTLCYPLVCHQRLIGVLQLFRRTSGGAFAGIDRQVIEILGQQTAAAIANAQFHAAQQNYFPHVIELLRLCMSKHLVWEGHLHNVTRYCSLISRKLNLDSETRRDIHFAAILHDIGFARMGSLVKHSNRKQFLDRYREHPVLGAELIKPIIVWKGVAPLILHHHEYYDGTGYPEGLRRDEIPIGARIICVVEALDTMTNPNSYASTQSREQAMADLQSYTGTRYDPAVINALVEALGEEK